MTTDTIVYMVHHPTGCPMPRWVEDPGQTGPTHQRGVYNRTGHYECPGHKMTMREIRKLVVSEQVCQRKVVSQLRQGRS